MDNTEQPQALEWKFYRFNENLLSTLINKHIWYSKYQFFNDPFDCDLQTDETIRNEIEKYFVEEDQNFIDLAQRTAMHHITGLKDKFLQASAFFCICKNWHHPLMWSHYADEHKGIVLGFNSLADSSNEFEIQYNSSSLHEKTENLLTILRNVVKTTYSDERLSDIAQQTIQEGPQTYGLSKDHLAGFESALSEWLFSYCYTKAECWQYESEIRLTTRIEETNKDHAGQLETFSAEQLSDVIFGLRTPRSTITTILKLLSTEEFGHIKFWQAEKDHLNLKIIAKPLKV